MVINWYDHFVNLANLNICIFSYGGILIPGIYILMKFQYKCLKIHKHEKGVAALFVIANKNIQMIINNRVINGGIVIQYNGVQL